MSQVLPLEDEPIIARNICRVLARDGHAVTLADRAVELRNGQFLPQRLLLKRRLA